MTEEFKNVTGLSDLQKFLDEFTPKMEANVMRGALRAGLNEVKPVAKQNIHRVSGELAEGLKIGTRLKGHTAIARLRVTGPHAHVAKWVEFGTIPHLIAAKLAGVLVLFGGVFRKFVQHPGAKPKPFLRPALDSQAQAAVVAAGNYIKNRLATKNGIDTSHVTVQGEDE